MHLVDHARIHIERTYRRPLADRALRAFLGQVLPYNGRFRLALVGASLARPLARLVPGQSMTAQRLRAMLRLAPDDPDRLLDEIGEQLARQVREREAELAAALGRA